MQGERQRCVRQCVQNARVLQEGEGRLRAFQMRDLNKCEQNDSNGGVLHLQWALEVMDHGMLIMIITYNGYEGICLSIIGT